MRLPPAATHRNHRRIAAIATPSGQAGALALPPGRAAPTAGRLLRRRWAPPGFGRGSAAASEHRSVGERLSAGGLTVVRHAD